MSRKTLVSQIDALLNKGANGLLDLRLKRKRFSDDYHRKRTFMQTCEGLEGVFQVALACEKVSLIKKLFTDPVAREIEKDIEYLEGNVTAKDYTWFPGDPYYTRGRRPPVPRNSVDALAFFTSVLCHLLGLLKIKGSRSFGQYDDSNIKRHLNKCIDVIIDNTISESEKAGWPAFLSSEVDVDPNYVSTPDHYSTWSILETIEEMRQYYPEGYDRISNKGCLLATREWLASEMEHKIIPECQSFLANLNPEIDLSGPQCCCFYHAVHGIAGLAILGATPTRKFGHFTAQVLNAKPYILENEFIALYPKLDADDYTLVPMLLRCLSAAFASSVIKGPASGLGVLGEHKESILLDLYTHIITKKLHYGLSGSFDGFFCERDVKKAKNGESRKVDIYYTERVIECLTAYREYLGVEGVEKTVEVMKPAKLPTKDPFFRKTKTRTRAKGLEARLPALRIYTSELKDKYGPCFAKFHIILVQHFLNDLPAFVKQIMELGADPDRWFWSEKRMAIRKVMMLRRSWHK